jgi:ABC-type lipoprotein release transport system permease subunit
MLFSIAWRNIWRNRRRTLITASSIFLAIFLALIMRSMQIGSYARIIDNIVHSYTGYIQIHKQGYWEEKEINNSFFLSDSLMKKISALSNVKYAVPRLESFALASAGAKTKGVMVIGIVPGKEEKLSDVKKNIIRGSYLDPDDSGVLLAKRIADYLGMKVNDTLVLISQGYHGVSAAGKFPVRGITHFSSPDLDNTLIYLTLKTAQEFYTADNLVTSVSIDLHNKNKIGKTKKELTDVLDPNRYEVMRWNDMMVEVVQHIQSDNISGLIMLGILYMVIGFGIFGTMLMMTMERIREFGVMISLGMQKGRLAILVLLESLFIGLTGIIAGAMVSFPLIVYYYYHPIHLGGEVAKSTESYGYEALLSFEPPGMYFFNNGLLVLLIILVAMIYPLGKIFRLNIINALRNKL